MIPVSACSSSPTAWLDGATLCYPFVGPVQQFDPALKDSALVLVQAHEAVHAEQCRRMGAVKNFLTRVGRRGRTRLEAQAYCAQAGVELTWGRSAAYLTDRIQEELIVTVEHITFGRVTPLETREILLAECPALAG